ncbi:MAG TPA: hypothetical protein DCG12_15820 [Planctomycetaceae bacterium]|nr:hypothetical protein [Planctomycetaceae bacterium]
MSIKLPTLATILFLSAMRVVPAQECKDGVCRIPARSTFGAAESGYPGFGPQSFDLKPAVPHLTGGRDSHHVCRCKDCGCSGRDCTCGPNCPSHYQTRHGLQSGSAFRSRTPQFGRSVVSAPRPVSYERQHRPVTVSWQTDLQRALHLAERTGRPVLIRITAPWCGHCERMKRDTFTDPRIVHDINTGFIPVTIDAEEQAALVERMGVSTLPTMLVISPERRVIGRSTGYQSVSQLSSLLIRHMRRAELETGIRVVGEPAGIIR